MKVYEFKVDNYDFTMVVDKDDISIHVTSPESFPFPDTTLNFKNDNETSPIKDRTNCSMGELVEEVAVPPKDPNKELWWQEYKLSHKQQYLNEITAALNKTFNSEFEIVEQQQ